MITIVYKLFRIIWSVKNMKTDAEYCVIDFTYYGFA